MQRLYTALNDAGCKLLFQFGRVDDPNPVEVGGNYSPGDYVQSASIRTQSQVLGEILVAEPAQKQRARNRLIGYEIDDADVVTVRDISACAVPTNDHRIRNI